MAQNETVQDRRKAVANWMITFFKSPSAAAKHYSLTAEYVRNICKDFNVPSIKEMNLQRGVEIIKMLETGSTMKEAAKKFKVAVSTAQTSVNLVGYKAGKGPKGATEKTFAVIGKLLNTELSYRAIGIETNVSKSTVENIAKRCKKYNIIKTEKLA